MSDEIKQANIFSDLDSKVLVSKVDLTEIDKTIYKNFDYDFDGTTKFEVPHMPKIEEGFSIGVIYGSSGSGKSTLLKNFGQEEALDWDRNRSVASHFASEEDAINDPINNAKPNAWRFKLCQTCDKLKTMSCVCVLMTDLILYGSQTKCGTHKNITSLANLWNPETLNMMVCVFLLTDILLSGSKTKYGTHKALHI